MIAKLPKLLLLSIIAGLTTSCMVDKVAVIHFTIRNESSRDIDIKFDFAGTYYHLPDNVELRKGAAITLSDETGIGGTPVYPYIREAIITFDSNVEIVHRRTTESHSICNESDCEVNNKDEYERTYTFTFTDADYEYAVSQQNE